MTFSVSDGVGDFEYNGASPNGLFAKRAHMVTPWFHRMIADMARFNHAERGLLHSDQHEPVSGSPSRVVRNGTAQSSPDHRDAGPSLGDWLEQQHFSRPFIECLIVPQVSAVWSADPRQMWTFPARFLAEFFDNHGMLGFRNRPKWRTINGGSARYVEAMTAPWRERIRINAPVDAVHRVPDHVLVTPRGAPAERFDEVVIATHSDQALALLADATPTEHDLLGAIPYQGNEAVLHTDTSLLPRRRRVGELELPPAGIAHRSHDGHLPHEPPAVARRRTRVLRDAQPDRGDRAG
jgi:predicted NAD/FAD-binding protein